MKIFRNRTVIGVLCILLALIICFGITPIFSRRASEKTEIVRVTKDIREGDEITAEMVQTVEVGAYNLPQNLMTDKKEVMPSFKGSTDKAPDENYRYTFTGWSPEVVVAEEDATYTAQYSATARVFYTITFNANGGEGSMEPQRFEVGVDTALNTNAFTRENYKFIGWNTAADGSGATYADEGAILELTGDMTLYAQWQFWNGWLTVRKLDFWMKMYGSLAPCLRKPCVVIWKAQAY